MTQDVVVELPPGGGGRKILLDVLRSAWPEGILEEDSDREIIPLLEATESDMRGEIFIYSAPHWRHSWDEHGATPENNDQMVHLLFSKTEESVTCVTGCGGVGIPQKIRAALRKDA